MKTRRQILKQMDNLLAQCKICPKRIETVASKGSVNSLQKYCNKQCKVGRELRVIAGQLDQTVRDRRERSA